MTKIKEMLVLHHSHLAIYTYSKCKKVYRSSLGDVQINRRMVRIANPKQLEGFTRSLHNLNEKLVIPML